MKIVSQDLAKGRKRVHSDVNGFKTKEEEDAHYRKKIEKLVQKKMKLIAEQIEEESEVKPPTENEPMNSNPIVSNRKLEEFITNEMNGEDMTLVIKKKLYASDLLKSQNRLSMPMNQLETHEFLTETERQDLENEKEFEVQLLGPRLQFHDKPMVMKMWRLKSTCSYVLKTNWNDFVKENKNDLKEKTKIQVWSFRKENRLCFALSCV